MIALAATLVAGLASARAEPGPCLRRDSDGRPFVTCFDPGNRLAFTADTDGFGGELRLRHTVHSEDGDIDWRLEHGGLQVVADGDRARATLYAGRYLRHARDGHVVLPLWPTRKLWVPFDIGAEAEVGEVDVAYDADSLRLGAVRAALLFELTRASHHRRRVAIGAVARWELDLDRGERAVRAHTVAPMSLALLDLYLESQDGLTAAGLRAEGGAAWTNADAATGQPGWRTSLRAELRVERVLLAVNDQPISVYALGRYQSPPPGAAAEPWVRDLSGVLGLRLAFSLAAPRVGK